MRRIVLALTDPRRVRCSAARMGAGHAAHAAHDLSAHCGRAATDADGQPHAGANRYQRASSAHGDKRPGSKSNLQCGAVRPVLSDCLHSATAAGS